MELLPGMRCAIGVGMIWLKDILIFMIGMLVGYYVRRSVEVEFHVRSTDDEDA